jgi:hypothetical protein
MKPQPRTVEYRITRPGETVVVAAASRTDCGFSLRAFASFLGSVPTREHSGTAGSQRFVFYRSYISPPSVNVGRNWGLAQIVGSLALRPHGIHIYIAVKRSLSSNETSTLDRALSRTQAPQSCLPWMVTRPPGLHRDETPPGRNLAS